MKAIKAKIKAKLEQAGIPFHEIVVFGATRCNVHVRCVGSDTSEKWALLLGSVFGGSKVSTINTVWDAVENKGTSLLPTKRKGFLIAVSA